MHLTFEKLAGVQYYTIFKKHTFHYFASCIPALFALVDSTEKKNRAWNKHIYCSSDSLLKIN